ncbi:MAG TPA: hypothetical protein VFA94_16850 [Acidimicrobiales bacterium]|nr:hypothetical protein [Acidimicrobiales bacterium]
MGNDPDRDPSLTGARRDIVGESESLVEQHVTEHAELKWLLAQVDGTPASTSSAFKIFMNEKRMVQDHVEHEESGQRGASLIDRRRDVISHPPQR